MTGGIPLISAPAATNAPSSHRNRALSATGAGWREPMPIPGVMIGNGAVEAAASMTDIYPHRREGIFT